MKSFQIVREFSIVTVATIGFKRGNVIFQKIRKVPAPSIFAASSSSSGIVATKLRNINVANGILHAMLIKITDAR